MFSAEAQRQLTKLQSELASQQQKFESQAVGTLAQETEDLKRKTNAKIQDITSQLEASQSKALGLEKAKNRLQSEMEDLTAEMEQVGQ